MRRTDQCHRDETSRKRGHMKRPPQGVGPEESRASRQTLGDARRNWVLGQGSGSALPTTPPLKRRGNTARREMVTLRVLQNTRQTEPGV